LLQFRIITHDSEEGILLSRSLLPVQNETGSRVQAIEDKTSGLANLRFIGQTHIFLMQFVPSLSFSTALQLLRSPSNVDTTENKIKNQMLSSWCYQLGRIMALDVLLNNRLLFMML
jgi:hypothetical protein